MLGGPIRHFEDVTDTLAGKGIVVPVLGIEADVVDRRTCSDARVKDQKRAFMETVGAAKREGGPKGWQS